MKFKNLIIGLILSCLSILIIIKPDVVLYAAVLFVGVYGVINGITNLKKLEYLTPKRVFCQLHNINYFCTQNRTHCGQAGKP